MTNEQEYLLYLEDVYKVYSLEDSRHKFKIVLNDIDLKVKSGEFITVVGPTGCGKSTLLKLILGAEYPTSGILLVDGEKIESVNRNRGIVFQKYSLFPHFTVLQNIMFGLELESFNMIQKNIIPFFYRKRFKVFKEKAYMYLERIGLQKMDAEKYPNQLSGGMQQRVAIAQAMIMEPRILLMDEPFGALDDNTRQSMQLFLLEQWKKSGTTIFFITHSLEEALFLGTRVIVLSQYYLTDDPNGNPTTQGSKIITDAKIPKYDVESDKYTVEFNKLMAEIRQDLNPNNRKYIKEFNLTHPNSFRTVGDSEWKGGYTYGK